MYKLHISIKESNQFLGFRLKKEKLIFFIFAHNYFATVLFAIL